MSVFSKVRGFLGRHRNKFLIGGVVITGSIFLTHYAQRKLKEWQEREALEFLERNRKQQHFDSIGRTGNQTIMNLSLSLHEVISRSVNTEDVIERLKGNPDDKIALWNELKVKVFTKAACTIYATVMLVTTLKIQLSIVGGYLYRDSNSLPAEMQERYLSLCPQYLLDAGFKKIHRLLETVCEKVLETVDLKKQVRLSDLEAIFWSIQTAILTSDSSANPIEKLRHYVVPGGPTSDVGGDSSFHNMMRDTVDLLDSDEVKHVATQCVNRGFMLLAEQLSEFYTSDVKGVASTSVSDDEYSNPFESKKAVAKILPIMNGLLSYKALPDQFLQQLIAFGKLQMLSANVYESFLS